MLREDAQSLREFIPPKVSGIVARHLDAGVKQKSSQNVADLTRL